MTDDDDHYLALSFTSRPPQSVSEANAYLNAHLPELAVRFRERGVLSSTQGIAVSLLRTGEDNWRDGLPVWLLDQAEAHLRDHPDERPVVILVSPAPLRPS